VKKKKEIVLTTDGPRHYFKFNKNTIKRQKSFNLGCSLVIFDLDEENNPVGVEMVEFCEKSLTKDRR